MIHIGNMESDFIARKIFDLLFKVIKQRICLYEMFQCKKEKYIERIAICVVWNIAILCKSAYDIQKNRFN